MLKKVKWLLIIVGIIVLCIGGYVLYELKIKSYDVADVEIDKLTEETFEVELPDGTVVQFDKDGNIVETDSTTDFSSPSINATSQAPDTTSNGDGTSSNTSNGVATTQTNGNTQNSNNVNSADTTKKATVADIKGKYATTFKSLETQVNGRINALISQGLSEYKAKKSNGESISYGYFYKKYMGAATSIEKATDAAVNGVVRIVENELSANGYDKSYAQSFISDYEETKEALRSEMLNKALSFR